MVLTKLVRGENITSGALLGADLLLAQVFHGDVRALSDNDLLHTVGIGVGEVQNQLALLVNGDAGHDDVALAALGGSQGAVEVHVENLELQAQLLGDGGGDLSVDAHHGAGVVGHLIGREGSVGGHGEHALGDGGELCGGSGVLGGGGILAGVGGGITAASQGQHAKKHGARHEDGKELFHVDATSFHFNFFVPPPRPLGPVR